MGSSKNLTVIHKNLSVIHVYATKYCKARSRYGTEDAFLSQKYCFSLVRCQFLSGTKRVQDAAISCVSFLILSRTT